MTGDFNSDGYPDVATNAPGGMELLLGDGDGTFQSPVTRSVFPHARPLSLAAAAFDQDGRLDLVLANWEFSWADNTPVSVLLGNGDGTLQDPLNYNSHRGQQYPAVADFNQDSFPDLAQLDGGDGVAEADEANNFVRALQPLVVEAVEVPPS